MKPAVRLTHHHNRRPAEGLTFRSAGPPASPTCYQSPPGQHVLSNPPGQFPSTYGAHLVKLLQPG